MNQEIDSFSTDQVKFNPTQFFIPGWKGEGLISNHGLQIKSVLNNLTIDAISLFKKQNNASNAMKKLSYEEFLAFARFKELNLQDFSQPSDFWFHLQDETSPYQKQIEEFIRLFCFRAAAIYLFRIKFIIDLSRELKIELSDDTLLNPLSFLGRIFKKNSSTELTCESLQINQYSWYRPTPEYKDNLIKIQEAFSKVTLTELIKLLSTPKDNQIYSLKNYSHSLSHLSFGEFLNNLILQFPKWLKVDEKVEKENFYSTKTSILPKTVSTLFEGKHISSLALSHWLSQEANVQKSQWNSIICPNFKGDDFVDGIFLKICQELQFLSFLTKIAVEHNYEVVPFICKTMKDKNNSAANDKFDQISLLDLTEDKNSIVSYDRIVLNLMDSPKNNPHHHLVNQILSKKNNLKKDGVIFVLSNQKLFVPSHSERVELLLREFKLNAIFNLDELKGIGEIPHYIYVLKPREQKVKQNPHLFKINRQEKESCFTFQFKGNLNRFNKFNKIVHEFQHFLKNRKVNNTPIYIMEVDQEITFEFHLDAIIEGKLVSSSSNKELGQTTHPAFFKNLIKTSVSFDTFFHLDILNPHDSNINKNINDLLGVKANPMTQYSLLLLVNQTNPIKIELELVPFESYKAKIEENGTAFFTYFGLTPKHSAININAFREYFNSKIGFQIIQMQLSDGPNKLKGKLKSLLVPSFLAQTQFMPKENLYHFALLEKEPNDLLKLHPDDLNLKFELIEEQFYKLKNMYPWHLLGLFSHFKLNLKNSISENEITKKDEIQFSNPIITKELMSLKTYSIYPKNQDVYVNIDTENHKDLQLPMTSFQLKNESNQYSITLLSSERKIVSFYSNESLIQFIKFILQNATGIKIADILIGLKLPTIVEFENVISKFSMIKENKHNLIKKTDLIISKIFQDQISL
jgi:hypothetical protein